MGHHFDVQDDAITREERSRAAKKECRYCGDRTRLMVKDGYARCRDSWTCLKRRNAS